MDRVSSFIRKIAAAVSRYPIHLQLAEVDDRIAHLDENLWFAQAAERPLILELKRKAVMERAKLRAKL